jgi:hypothetical protein
MKPASHVTEHLLAAHSGLPLAEPAQAALHAPQWRGSRAVSTQAALQFIVPLAQESLHAPAEQTLPAAQLFSHEPQCFGSLPTSMHSPSQSTYGARQVVRHCPASQVARPPGGDTHTLPHPPQFATSAC